MKIEQTALITNDFPYESTIQQYAEKGYRLIAVDDAHKFHPYATVHDKICFFAKAISKDDYDDSKQVNNLDADNYSHDTKNIK